MNEITMRVVLEIYQQSSGTLRCMEEINLNRPLTIVEAAEVLQRFSLLAQQVKAGK